MAFTEFHVDASTGSNANGGSDHGSPTFTDAAGTWSNSLHTITTSVSTASVTVGQFCNVGGSYLARVTAVSAGLITLSSTAASGTNPSSANYNCVVGGPWKGPNGSTIFPFGLITNALTDAGGDIARINFYNTAQYSITAQMTANTIGPFVWQGCTSSPGDGGQAVFDASSAGTINMLNASNNYNIFINITFQNNGTTGTGSCVTCGVYTVFYLCVFSGGRNNGLTFTASGGTIVACEAFGNNTANTGGAGFLATGDIVHYIRCYSHNNTNGFGFNITSGSAAYDSCIADSNGSSGFKLNAYGGVFLKSCDAYNNTSHGIEFTNGSSVANPIYIENGSLVKNGGYGIAGTGAGSKLGFINNVAFGSGTQANTSGQTNGIGFIQTSGFVTLASGVTPWFAPTTGNFSINLAACENTGIGNFTETGNSKTGTVGYPDIGAAPHQSSAGSSAFRGIETGGGM